MRLVTDEQIAQTRFAEPVYVSAEGVVADYEDVRLGVGAGVVVEAALDVVLADLAEGHDVEDALAQPLVDLVAPVRYQRRRRHDDHLPRDRLACFEPLRQQRVQQAHGLERFTGNDNQTQ